MQIVEIVEPRVKEGNELIHMPLFKAERDPDGATVFKPTGTIPLFVRQLEQIGISVPKRIFTA
jgi:pilus assembly protein CpaF